MAERVISFEEACRRYVHRYTMEYVPAWATRECGVVYAAPQYRTDREWYDNTLFPGEGDVPRRSRFSRSIRQTWPLGKTLDAPYRP
jgi:hypothetical protein